MAEPPRTSAGLPVGAVRLKWPNDLVIEAGGPRALLVGDLTPEAAAARLAAPLELRKLAGILGETEGLGTDDPRVVVGLGINADWAAADFPPELAATMTSLRDASGGRPIDREALLDAFLDRLEARLDALRAGFFDVGGWTRATGDDGPARDPRGRRRDRHRAPRGARRRRRDRRPRGRGRRGAGGERRSTRARSSGSGSPSIRGRAAGGV